MVSSTMLFDEPFNYATPNEGGLRFRVQLDHDGITSPSA
jgi:hypothetical protein